MLADRIFNTRIPIEGPSGPTEAIVVSPWEQRFPK